jgi:N-acetylglutamate synthase
MKKKESIGMSFQKITNENRMPFQILGLTISDYETALALWRRCEGIGLSDADEKQPLTCFLEKNKGLNFKAVMGDKLVGTCLCGSDGRRGYLYHLAVDPAVRRLGIGKALVEQTLSGLHKIDIHKCHIMVFGKNELGLKFWQQTGWKLRPEIEIMSYEISPFGGGSLC